MEVGGLISYGPNQDVGFAPAAGYVDRILKGEKPADLPVQAPDKYELVINLLKTGQSAWPCNATRGRRLLSLRAGRPELARSLP